MNKAMKKVCFYNRKPTKGHFCCFVKTKEKSVYKCFVCGKEL